MAFAEQFSATVYAGNGSASTSYPVEFPIVTVDHVFVTVESPAGSAPVVLAPHQYTVHDGGGGNYSVTTTTAWPATATVTVFRSVPLDQPFEFPEGGSFRSAEVERALDRVVMQMHQLWRTVTAGSGGTVVLPGGGTGVKTLAVWSDSVAQTAVTPQYTGQLGVRVSDGTIWVARSLATGDWTEFQPPERLPRRVYQVAVMSDAGLDNQDRNILAETLLRDAAELWLAGDNNYGLPGAIAAANVPFETFLAAGKVRTAEGNHDIDQDAGAAQRAFFNGRPASPDGLPGCYVDVGKFGGLLDLIVLQSGRNTDWEQTVTGGVALGSPMHAWFMSVLPGLKAPHRVVMFHHPAWSPADGANRHEPDMDWPWWEYGITLVITGHVHLNFAGWRRGVLHLGAGAGANASGAMSEFMEGAAVGSTLEWAETEMVSGYRLFVSASDLRYEAVSIVFREGSGNAAPETVLHSGSAYTPRQLPWMVDTDVVAPDQEIPTSNPAPSTLYVTNAPGAFYLDTIHLSVVTPGALMTIQVLVNGQPVLQPAAQISAGSRRYDRTNFFLDPVGEWVKDRRKIEVEVSGGSIYGGPPNPKGLRVALCGRRITT